MWVVLHGSMGLECGSMITKNMFCCDMRVMEESTERNGMHLMMMMMMMM